MGGYSHDNVGKHSIERHHNAGVRTRSGPGSITCEDDEHWDEALQKCVKNTIPQTGEKDENGVVIPFQRTGKFVNLTTGNNHRNGQRYSVNHEYEIFCPSNAWIFQTRTGTGNY